MATAAPLPCGPRWPAVLANTGAALVPGLALALPSGYSYGAVLLLVAALASLPHWWGRPMPRAGWMLLTLFAAMGLLWLADEHDSGSVGMLDRPIKYLLALPCIAFLMRWRPGWRWLALGIGTGAIGAGIVGLAQVGLQGLPRASGFTNAIQYGDLAALLALQSALLLTLLWPLARPWQRMLLGAGAALGVVASVLSQARGGWLALALLWPVAAWLLARSTGRRHAYAGLAAFVLGGLALLQLPAVQERVALAEREVQVYVAHGDGESSVGHRLAHWRLAWGMGLERPLLGWGRSGYEAEKARLVAAGAAPAVVREFGHAHNEVLDLWAKHGLVGVLLLALFYGVPLALLWPTPARVRTPTGEVDRPALALALVGVMLPLSYAAFGLTQVFLAHNSGNLFYLFMCPLVLAALHERRAQLQASA